MLSRIEEIEQENLRKINKNNKAEEERALVTTLPTELIEKVVNFLDYRSAWSLSQVSFFFRQNLLGKGANNTNMLQRLFDYEGIFAAVYHAMRASAYPFTDAYVCLAPMKPEVQKDSNGLLPQQVRANERLFIASLQGHNALPVFSMPQGELNLGHFHWIAAFQHIIFNPSLSDDMRIVAVYVLLKSNEQVDLLSTYFEAALKRQYSNENVVDLIEFHLNTKYPTLSFVKKIGELIIQSSAEHYQLQGYDDVKAAQAYWKKSLDNFIDLQKHQLKTSQAEREEEQQQSKHRCMLM